MEKEWEEKEIVLLQTSVDHYPFCLRPSQSSQRQTTITFYDPSDSPVKPGSHGPEVGSRDQLYSVHGGEEMKGGIEAALLELNVMLSSPHLGGLKGKVQLLRSSVQQVNEIFSLLLHCQNKVYKPTPSQTSDLYTLHLLSTVAGSFGAVSPYKAITSQIVWSSEIAICQWSFQGSNGECSRRPTTIFTTQQESREKRSQRFARP